MNRIGVDLGGTKIQSIVLGAGDAVLASERVATPRGSYQATLEAVVSTVRNLEQTVGGEPLVGIGAPGIWQPARGAMKNCNSTWLNGRPLLTDLTELLGARVKVANDADCFALSEASSGAGVGFSSVFGVILGTGVGGGLVVNGQLLTGPNGLTGEWGHTPLPYLGLHDCSRDSVPANADFGQRQAALDELESRLELRDCYCGRSGCVETYLSGPGLQRSHFELWGEERTSESIASSSAEHSDEQAALTLALYCRMLARSLAQVINIVDPAVIVLGGGLSNIGEIYARLNEQLAEYVFSGECVTVAKPPVWGSESGVLGAARLWPAE